MSNILGAIERWATSEPILVISSAQGKRAVFDREAYEAARKDLVSKGLRTIRPAPNN